MTTDIRKKRHDEERASLLDIQQRFGAQFALMGRVLDFVEDILSGGSLRGNKRRGLNLGVVYLVAVMLAKACKTFRATRAACRAGCGQDASVLLRELFETALGAAYVLQRDSKRRAAMFAAHADQRLLVSVESARKTRGIKRMFSAKDLERAKRKVEAWLRVLTPSELASVRRHWCPTGIEGAAKSLRRGGWEKAYNTLYRYTSAFSHGSDVHVHFFLAPGADTPSLKLLPGDAELPRVAMQACFLLLSICGGLDERFGMGLSSEIGALQRESIETFAKHKSEHPTVSE